MKLKIEPYVFKNVNIKKTDKMSKKETKRDNDKLPVATLYRLFERGDWCIGVLEFKGKGYIRLCVLERSYQSNIKNVSSIPEGEYEIVRDHTGKHKYIKVLNVPDRSNIEIHPANKWQELKGCIALGEALQWQRNGEPWLLNSQKAVYKFTQWLEKRGGKGKLIIKKLFNKDLLYE